MEHTRLELDALFKRRATYSGLAAKLVGSLEREGFVTGVQMLGEGAYSVETTCGYRMTNLARIAAEQQHRGVFCEVGNDQALRWGMGNMTAAVFLRREHVEAVLAGQRIVREVIPAHLLPPPAWTIAGSARQLVNFVREREFTVAGGSADLLRRVSEYEDCPGDRRYQYNDCQPGRYNKLVMYDANAYYFNLIARLPCLDVSIYPNVIDWGEWRGREEAKWLAVIRHIGETKLLRNALWGVLLGGNESKLVFTSAPKAAGEETLAGGRRVWKEASPAGRVRTFRIVYGGGLARAAAVLVARSGAELCAEAAQEVGSVYSTMDSVTSIDGSRPHVWDRVGLPSGVKERGDIITDGFGGHVVRRGVWRMGDHSTQLYYDKGRDFPPGYLCPEEPVAVPRQSYKDNYYKLWLE